jgi:hypothetical protein
VVICDREVEEEREVEETGFLWVPQANKIKIKLL